ncbi:MAG: hypothetical protein PHI85_10170 [Victivallaceae bacterium]|nr:hypothetical protein [Victivallaceae bacterium]
MDDFLRIPVWYKVLKKHTFPTNFLNLTPSELQALAAGEEDTPTAKDVIARMRPLMHRPGNNFVLMDSCAPTDTERYYAKRGAVHSARSAWVFLARSAKVRAAAAAGAADTICIRPFRRMSIPREFRLFFVDGELAAASQYFLIRHFRRLEGVKDKYWKLLAKFAAKIADKLPAENVVMDVYVTSDREVLVLDLNVFGPPTSPLLLRSWEQDWKNIDEPKLKLMPPPVKISGEVTVSF